MFLKDCQFKVTLRRYGLNTLLHPMQKLITIWEPQHKLPSAADVKEITVPYHVYFSTRSIISLRTRHKSQKYAERWNRCNCINLVLFAKHPMRTLLMMISSQVTIKVSGNTHHPSSSLSPVSTSQYPLT